jgi:hypothetical protein
MYNNQRSKETKPNLLEFPTNPRLIILLFQLTSP